MPISSIYIGKHANTKKAKSFGKISRISKSNAVEGEFEIEVDFDSSITPGQFCYEICLFR